MHSPMPPTLFDVLPHSTRRTDDDDGPSVDVCRDAMSEKVCQIIVEMMRKISKQKVLTFIGWLSDSHEHDTPLII